MSKKGRKSKDGVFTFVKRGGGGEEGGTRHQHTFYSLKRLIGGEEVQSEEGAPLSVFADGGGGREVGSFSFLSATREEAGHDFSFSGGREKGEKKGKGGEHCGFDNLS